MFDFCSLYKKIMTQFRINIIVAMAIIEGPVGVSIYSETKSPIITERHPIIPEMNTIATGLRTNGRAAAGGIINMAVTNNIPTTLIATAIIMANPRFNIQCSLLGFIPEAIANSSLTVEI
ncbi:MAG: hypothetical protein OXF46_04420, partial [Rhodobacteraceae bacterium]|nr:hypothetical protein [Paracoccaceae bacterium]